MPPPRHIIPLFYNFAANNNHDMETTTNKQSSKATDWLLFLVFTVIFLLMLVYVDEWFWVPMPFMLTYLVKALDAM